MKNPLRSLFIVLLLIYAGASFAQVMGRKYSKAKRLVTIPASAGTSNDNSSFCICRVVSFSSRSYEPRTDAIFAERNAEKPIHVKQMLRNIDYELQQALVFFSSYTVIRQYASPVDCNTLYKYLKEKKEENINKYTFLSKPYAIR